MLVTKSNVRDYCQLVAYWRLVQGVRREMTAMRGALHAHVPSVFLRWFTAEELDEVLCGTSADAHWTMASLRAALRPEQGFNFDSPQVFHDCFLRFHFYSFSRYTGCVSTCRNCHMSNDVTSRNSSPAHRVCLLAVGEHCHSHSWWVIVMFDA